MTGERARTQSQYPRQSGTGGDQGRLRVPDVVQFLGGAELVPNLLLVEPRWLEFGSLAGRYERGLEHSAQISERLSNLLSIKPHFAG